MRAPQLRGMLIVMALACAKNPTPDTVHIPKSAPPASPDAAPASPGSATVAAPARVTSAEIERRLSNAVAQQLTGITITTAAAAEIATMVQLASKRLADSRSDEHVLEQATENVRRFAETARLNAKRESVTTATTGTMSTDTMGTAMTTTGPTATDTSGTSYSREYDVVDSDVLQATRFKVCPLYPFC